jgi:hypothetical protein
MNEIASCQYLAETESIGRFGIQLSIHLSSDYGPWQSRADFQIHATSSDTTKAISFLSANELPSLRAWYIENSRELHIEEIRRNCLLPGQGFASWVFESFCHLAPSATTIYLANVVHGPTASLIREALSTSPPRVLDDQPTPGPLIKALLRSGFRNIQPVREGLSSYIGLRATTSEPLPRPFHREDHQETAPLIGRPNAQRKSY